MGLWRISKYPSGGYSKLANYERSLSTVWRLPSKASMGPTVPGKELKSDLQRAGTWTAWWSTGIVCGPGKSGYGYDLLGASVALVVKEFTCQYRDQNSLGLILGQGRCPEEEMWLLQYSHGKIQHDRGAWQVRVHGVTQSGSATEQAHTLLLTSFLRLQFTALVNKMRIIRTYRVAIAYWNNHTRETERSLGLASVVWRNSMRKAFFLPTVLRNIITIFFMLFCLSENWAWPFGE